MVGESKLEESGKIGGADARGKVPLSGFGRVGEVQIADVTPVMDVLW